MKIHVTGLEVKLKHAKHEEIIKILSGQNEEMLRQIFDKQFLANKNPCKGLSEEKVTNEILQMEIIRMYVNDLAERGNIMDDLISKFQLDRAKISKSQGMNVHEKIEIG